MQELDERFGQSRVADERHREEIHSQFEKLNEGLAQEKLARELLDERKTKEVEVAGKQMQLLIQKFQKERLKAEQTLVEQIQRLGSQVEKERLLRQESEEKFGLHLGDQVSRLIEEVEHERQQNALLVARVQALENEVETLSNASASEKQARSDLELNMMHMLENICTRMQSELLAERKDRETMEETMLKLLEETCSRVEGGLDADPNADES